MKFLTESEYGSTEGTQLGLKSLFRAPLNARGCYNAGSWHRGGSLLGTAVSRWLVGVTYKELYVRIDWGSRLRDPQ